MDSYYKSPKNGCSEKEFLADNYNRITKRMVAFYNSPKYESQKLI